MRTVLRSHPKGSGKVLFSGSSSSILGVGGFSSPFLRRPMPGADGFFFFPSPSPAFLGWKGRLGLPTVCSSVMVMSASMGKGFSTSTTPSTSSYSGALRCTVRSGARACTRLRSAKTMVAAWAVPSRREERTMRLSTGLEIVGTQSTGNWILLFGSRRTIVWSIVKSECPSRRAWYTMTLLEGLVSSRVFTRFSPSLPSKSICARGSSCGRAW
mmetsp:Transcript_4456/g.14441  ORF Transcript_4456/g.14441 Transcript_4456/m.14441 type:complete len:213 (-) Transcript_4456:526-1164(-)